MTVTLKWCTPRGSAGVELHHTSGTYRSVFTLIRGF